MKKEMNISITEIFMSKAGLGNKGFDRCFYGTITREKDIVHGKIKVGDVTIEASAIDQWILGDKLDQMVLDVLNNKKNNTQPN